MAIPQYSCPGNPWTDGVASTGHNSATKLPPPPSCTHQFSCYLDPHCSNNSCALLKVSPGATLTHLESSSWRMPCRLHRMLPIVVPGSAMSPHTKHSLLGIELSMYSHLVWGSSTMVLEQSSYSFRTGRYLPRIGAEEVEAASQVRALMAIHGWTVAPLASEEPPGLWWLALSVQGGRAGGFRLDEETEQLESMCRSLFDILQRSLRWREIQTEEKRRRECQTQRPKEVEQKRRWKNKGNGREDWRKKKKKRQEFIC